MTRFQAWWHVRSVRERRLLWIMAILIAVVLTWLLVVMPLADARFEARQRYETAIEKLARARADAEAISEFERKPVSPLEAPLETFVMQAATGAGFPVARVQPEGPDAVGLVSDSVRAQAFFSWVHAMQRDHGLIVTRLRATPNSDRTLRVQVGFRMRRR